MQLGLTSCTLCPRRCGADRTLSYLSSQGAVGSFCGASDELEVSSVCIHRGEEPPLNPIVNVFFTHCNLQCIYCQNWQISGKQSERKVESIDSLAERICIELSKLSTPLLGFVTATHYIHQLPPLIEAIHNRGIYPTVVYNCGGYESVESLRTLEGLIDIYLPDFKYMDSAIAKAYSHAPDYPEVAEASLREMIRQVGAGLKVDDDGIAYRGLIVRHLVLPGHIDNSLAVLDKLSAISNQLSTFNPIRLSLMAQYFPPREGLPAPLDRTFSAEEYGRVVARAEELGLTEGWIQELGAQENYRPDFTKEENPFER